MNVDPTYQRKKNVFDVHTMDALLGFLRVFWMWAFLGLWYGLNVHTNSNNIWEYLFYAYNACILCKKHESFHSSVLSFVKLGQIGGLFSDNLSGIFAKSIPFVDHILITHIKSHYDVGLYNTFRKDNIRRLLSCPRLELLIYFFYLSYEVHIFFKREEKHSLQSK